MDVDVEQMCKSCHGCQVVGKYSPPELTQRTEPPTGPWQDLAADFMGPLPTGETLLVEVNYYSWYYNHAQDHHGVKGDFCIVWKPILTQDR